MKLAISGMAAVALCFSAPPAGAQSLGGAFSGAVTSTIVNYECGDNCYLILALPGGAELAGLCVAEACQPWNEEAAMPPELLGASVTVELGEGVQYDGAGTEMGSFLAFTTVTLK